MSNYIWITAEKEFMHHYPDAPRTVSFLRNEHRHNFKFKIYFEVNSDNRELEFIIIQRLIKGILFKMPFNLRAKSCEMIANDIWKRLSERYPKISIMIEVSEDGENGILYNYLPLKKQLEKWQKLKDNVK